MNLKKIGAAVRHARYAQGIETLAEFADRIEVYGADKPSIAKLCRIEKGVQPVPTDILVALAAIIGMPAARLRPDLAAMFCENAA